MRAVVTRVKEASVQCEGEISGRIEKGFLVLLGVGVNDTEEDAIWIADRISGLRVFEDESGKMNLNVNAVEGSILCVSNFTLYADVSSRRPGFTNAARPDTAEKLYQRVIQELRTRGHLTETGVFGGDMLVASVNDGPITIWLDSERRK